MSGSRLKRLLPVLLGGVGLSSVSAMAASLTPLNPVIGGTTQVNAISGAGDVLGGSSDNASGVSAPVVWGWGSDPATQGSWVINSTAEGYVTAVSNDGLGYTDYSFSGASGAIFGGVGYALLDPTGNLGNTIASGISDMGIVVGQFDGIGAYWTLAGGSSANAVLMPTIDGNTTGAEAVTPDGLRAVGWSQDTNGIARAVTWYGTGFQDLQILDPTSVYGASAGLAISDDASTIVGYVTNSGAETAAIWNGSAYGTINLVGPPGSSTSRAMAVNADGSIVGGTFELQSSAGTYHAFLQSGSALGVDLNDLLTDAGVDMTGIVLADVTGLSDSGFYMSANDTMAGQGYIVFFDGEIGGVTSGAAQVASLSGVADQRAALTTQPGAYQAVLLGDLNAQNGGTELSAFGLYGSAAGGIKGTTTVGNLTVNAGVMLGTGDYGTVAYDGGLAAASLRYDLGTGDTGLNPFVEAGGSFGRLQNLTFRRSYANGASTTTGIGTTDGFIASTFARLGVEADLTADDEITLMAEIGQHWLSTSAYSEAQSATNPFPGQFAAATDTSTSAEAAASWTHRFDDTADFTLRAAVGTTFAASSDLVASTAGAGTQAVAPVGGLYAEAGLRLGWMVSDSTRLDLYASGTTGERIGTAGHVGAGLSVGF